MRRVCGPIALQDGADAAQEALIAIFKNLGGLREPAAIYGWARAIAVREAIRVVRAPAAAPARAAARPAAPPPITIRSCTRRIPPEPPLLRPAVHQSATSRPFPNATWFLMLRASGLGCG